MIWEEIKVVCLKDGTLQNKETVKGRRPAVGQRHSDDQVRQSFVSRGMEITQSVKVLGLDCVTCIRLMINIFIVKSSIWQFLDYSLFYLSITILPLILAS